MRHSYSTLLVVAALCLAGCGKKTGQLWAECEQTSDTAQRIRSCEKIIENPKLKRREKGAAYTQLCHARAREGSWSRAADACIKGNSPYPQVANYVNLGAAHVMLGHSDEALKSLQHALQMDPDRPKAHYVRGRAYELQGRRKEALAEYREARRLGDPAAPGSIKKLVRPKLKVRRC